MSLEIVLLVLSSLGLVIGLGITYWLHSQYHLDVALGPCLPATGVPSALVSLIVPARNEQRNITRCLQALLTQTHPQIELIVIDDRSSDDTPRLLAELASQYPGRLGIILGADLPQGWAGKPHALAQGAAAATGDWLCFIDADTFAGPGLVSSALATAEQYQADMLTILTFQELDSFWEKAILPLVFTALSVGFSPRRVNDPKKPDAIANGQFILIRRAVYQALGGHAAVGDQIVEDKALAELVKRSGYRLLVADGRRVARTRMYTTLSEIWEGWTKNIYLGMRDRLGFLLFGALVGLLGALLLPAWLFGGISWWAVSGSPVAALIALQGMVLWLALLAIRILASRAFGISMLYAFTLPLGAAMFTAMMFTSAFNVLSRRGVTWKGRLYR